MAVTSLEIYKIKKIERVYQIFTTYIWALLQPISQWIEAQERVPGKLFVSRIAKHRKTIEAGKYWHKYDRMYMEVLNMFLVIFKINWSCKKAVPLGLEASNK